MKEVLIQWEDDQIADEPPQFETASGEPIDSRNEFVPENVLAPSADVEQMPEEHSGAENEFVDEPAEKSAVTGNDFYEIENEIENPQAKVPSFSDVLDEISHSEPNAQILIDYLSVSSNAELRRLDVRQFLSFENGAVATRDVTLRRRSLHLILCGESLVRAAAGSGGLNFEQQAEALSLIEEMQTVGSGLSLSMYEVAGDGKKEKTDSLLYAANNLLAARLRLNPLIDKPKPVAEKPFKVEPANDLPVQPKFVSPPKSSVKAPVNPARQARSKPGRWLIAAALLICTMGAAFYVVTSFNETASATVKQARNIDLQRLRGSENLVVAKVNSETLIGVTDKNWKDLSLEKKNERLQQLVGDGKQHQYKSILLIDFKGDVVANGTEKEITLK